MHISCFLYPRNINRDPENIDYFISYEILNKELDPEYYNVVQYFRIHCSCGTTPRPRVHGSQQSFISCKLCSSYKFDLSFNVERHVCGV